VRVSGSLVFQNTTKVQFPGGWLIVSENLESTALQNEKNHFRD